MSEAPHTRIEHYSPGELRLLGYTLQPPRKVFFEAWELRDAIRWYGPARKDIFCPQGESCNQHDALIIRPVVFEELERALVDGLRVFDTYANLKSVYMETEGLADRHFTIDWKPVDVASSLRYNFSGTRYDETKLCLGVDILAAEFSIDDKDTLEVMVRKLAVDRRKITANYVDNLRGFYFRTQATKKDQSL